MCNNTCNNTCIIACKLINVTYLFQWDYTKISKQLFPKKWFKVSVYYYIYYNKYIFNTGETDEHQTILTCLEPFNSQEYFEQTQFIEQDSNETCQG